MKKPLIGITMGDPCGIGPEIILKAVSSPMLNGKADFLIIGSSGVLCKIAERMGSTIAFSGNSGNIVFKKEQLLSISLKSESLDSAAVADSYNHNHNQLSLLPFDNFPADKCFSHVPSAEGGRASVECILKGVDLAMEGHIDAVVTAPINKEAVKLGGFDYPGHTELLKERTNTKDVVMLMVGDKLKVSFVTSHIALSQVHKIITTDKIATAITITANALKRYMGIADPNIAVCGLNPHSGEAGRFGTEEEKIIIPAINRVKEMGIMCSGPVPADVVFFKARNGHFDAVVALYHDQGAIPIKLLAFETGVNITLGIPIVRTSPDHGTAYDIAGKGIANPDSMIEAIKYAIMMAEK